MIKTRYCYYSFLWSIVVILATKRTVAIHHNILDCPSLTLGRDTTVQQAFANSKCWHDTVVAANNDDDNNDGARRRIAYIPPNVEIQMMRFAFEDGLNNVTFQIDGIVLAASQHWKYWPHEKKRYHHFWWIQNATNFTVNGTGHIDGQGHSWWTREILQQNKYERPHLVVVNQVEHFEWSGVGLKNSPMYHLVPTALHAYFHDFEIYVDVSSQYQLSQQYYYYAKEWNHHHQLDAPLDLPTFPLNTDGIDFYGRNATFRRIKITNFDDAIVAKPNHRNSWASNCTQDILVENIETTYTVGMTIGSVPPNNDTNCIKNVLFRNITMHKPIKAIYIKTNPGYTGDGLIENITYENFLLENPSWWAIYIGPQQQKQPNGDGPGCMLYPIDPKCETSSVVKIRNITLRNITAHGSLLPPGIIRCNKTNPCENFLFENVTMRSPLWDHFGLGFIHEHAHGITRNVHPPFDFLTPKQEQEQQQQALLFDVQFPAHARIIQQQFINFVFSIPFLGNFIRDNLLNTVMARMMITNEPATTTTTAASRLLK